MTNPIRWLTFIALAGVALSSAAWAGPVLQVVTVKVNGDVDAYVKKIQPLMDMSKKAGATQTRIFRSTFAGDDTGLVFVSIEFADLEAFGKGTKTTQADPAWQKLIKDLDSSGIRTIVANSLMEDITP